MVNASVSLEQMVASAQAIAGLNSRFPERRDGLDWTDDVAMAVVRGEIEFMPLDNHLRVRTWRLKRARQIYQEQLDKDPRLAWADRTLEEVGE